MRREITRTRPHLFPHVFRRTVERSVVRTNNKSTDPADLSIARRHYGSNSDWEFGPPVRKNGAHRRTPDDLASIPAPGPFVPFARACGNTPVTWSLNLAAI